MRILIVGAGALGGLFGARLALHGEHVTLLEINLARAKLLNESGLFISQGQQGEVQVPVEVVTSVDGLRPFDLVFVAVKTYQTEAAVQTVLPVLGPETWVLSTQNGVGNIEQIARHVSRERILSGSTIHSIQHTGPNRIRYRAGIKPVQIAPVQGQVTPEIEAIGELFRKAGLDTKVVDNVDHAVWQKLLHNAVVNPISALTGMTCSELLEDDDIQQLMREVCMEIVAVMRARGVPIQDEEDPYRPVIGSQQALAKNRPSMWQDLVRGYRTEIDAMNGGIVDEALRLGLQAPLNWAIVRLMHSRERMGLRHKERAQRTLAEVRLAPPMMPAHPTVRGRLGGMPSGRVPLECAPKLKELVRGAYQELGRVADSPDGHVAWCSGFAPVEALRALGYTPYFPENHAALIGASRLATQYISRAIADGFSPFVSTEMTSDIGAMLAGETPLISLHEIRAVPRPQVLVYSTNFGQFVARWFEYYNHRFWTPVFGLHPPAFLDDIEQIDVDAAVQQMLRLIKRLERQAGRKMDMDKLAQTLELSAQAGRLWKKVLKLAEHVPSPLTAFDAVVHLAPMILMRGTPQAVQYYEILLAELEQRIASEVPAVPGERFRFYWEGPPIWCALRPLARLFLDQQVAVVGSTYASVFALTGFDPDNPIESMARTYMSIFPNRSREHKVQFLTDEFRRYGVDGVIYHDARTSPEHSNVRYGLHHRMERETGTPSLVIEADTHDLRLVSMDQIQRQLGEFIENSGRDGNGRARGKELAS
ncbi:MAG: 2-dehydropantoate 2-reductase [Pseudomonadota bacterium]